MESSLQNKRQRFRLGFLICFQCFLISVLHAQEPAYKRFTEDEGLPSDQVYGLLVDDDGMIWITTDNGVSKFDGIRFENYDIRLGLPDNEIFGAFQDKSGRIWFASYNGKPSYWRDGLIFNERTHTQLQNMRVGNYISAMAEDSAGNVYLGTRDGKLHIARRTGEVELFHSEIPSSMAAIGIKPGGTIDIATSSCEVLSISDGKVTYHRLAPELYPQRGRVSEVMVSTMISTGHFIYALGGRVSVISPSYFPTNFLETPLSIDSAVVFKIRELSNGRIFLCSSNGAYLFNGLDFNSTTFEHFLPGIHVSDMVEDKEGGWWFSSNQGLFYASEPRIRRFSVEGLHGDEAYTSMIKLTDSRIILGQGNGSVLELDLDDSAVTRYRIPDVRGYGMYANEFLGIDSSHIWLASDKYLAVVLVADRAVKPVFWDRAVDISRDNLTQRLCVCYAFGWSVFSEQELLGRLQESNGQLLANPGSTSRCHATEYDGKHVLWVANNTHLLKIYGSDTVMIPLTSESLGAIRITELEADPLGGMWIGTAGHGILWVNGTESAYFYDHETPGLNHINDITILDEGLLGVASNFGISTISYHANEKPVISSPIGRLDGLPSGRVFSMISTDSTLLVSTEMGLCQIPLQLIRDRAEFPRVKIDQITMGPNTLPLDSGQLLPYNAGVMKISFAGVCLQSLGQFTYRYRISGLHPDWQFTKSTQIELPLLEPGDYTFEVQAKNHQGNWSPLPATFAFSVSTPTWKSSWFQIGLPATIILAITFIFFRLYKQEKNRNRLLYQLRDAEQRALIGQMNPHFIFNSLNSIQFFFLNEDFAKANEFLADFGELIRSILNHSRVPRIRLSEELSQLELYLKLESARLSGKFEYRIEVGPTCGPERFMIPTMLIQPFVENSIWHGIGPLEGRKGLLTISIFSEDTSLVCEIRDNGIGRKRSNELQEKVHKRHKSQAMDILSERIKLINSAKAMRIVVEVIDVLDTEGQCAGTLSRLTFHFFHLL